jgi:hypothetical protein
MRTQGGEKEKERDENLLERRKGSGEKEKRQLNHLRPESNPKN